MVMFVWGAKVFFDLVPRRRQDALEIYVVGKQWMWKVQHPDGQREINELHVPVGRAGQADDDLRGRDPQLLHPGLPHQAGRRAGPLHARSGSRRRSRARYHLFCAEYCGTKHSGMIGWVTAMEPADYQAWLGGGAATRRRRSRPARSCSSDLACNTCHRPDGAGARAARSTGIFGKPVAARRAAAPSTADDAYLRESILNPQAKVVAGFQPIMPTFQGLVTEEQLLQLIAYIKSLGSRRRAPARRGRRPATVSVARDDHDHMIGNRASTTSTPATALQVVAVDARPQADRAPVPRRRSPSSSSSAGSSRC